MPFMAQALNPADVQLQFKRHLKVFSAPGVRASLRAIRVTRHKPGRRCLVEYDVAIERPGASEETYTLVGKARARGLDKNTFRVNEALWKAGLNDRAGDEVSVPEPAGMIPEFQMWLHRKVPGTTATSLLTGSRGPELARQIAQALKRLHHLGVRPDRRHTMADELRILHERLPLVAQLHPEWSTRIESLLADCDRLGASVPKPPRTGIHRDFYPDQVLVHGNRLYLLDLDLYCEGDPALDAGNFLGHVQEQSLRTLGDPHALQEVEGAFEERFVEMSGEQMRPAVQAYTTLTLARHVHLSTLFPQRHAFTGALLDLCEMRLSEQLSGRPARLFPVGPRNQAGAHPIP
jgi:hypothetical protein